MHTNVVCNEIFLIDKDLKYTFHLWWKKQPEMNIKILIEIESFAPAVAQLKIFFLIDLGHLALVSFSIPVSDFLKPIMIHFLITLEEKLKLISVAFFPDFWILRINFDRTNQKKLEWGWLGLHILQLKTKDLTTLHPQFFCQIACEVFVNWGAL